MVDLEEHNDALADQNEDFKVGAREGLEAMPELEKVQGEVQEIND